MPPSQRDPFDALLAEAAHVSESAPLLGPSLRRLPTPGASLCGGRFRVGRKLGEGGMGVVFHVHDAERGEQLALKCLRGRVGTLVELKREFRAVVDVEHPNLLRMHGLFAEQHLWFVTMELVDGVPFTAYARRHPHRVRELGAQLFSGLTELHRAGLVHRDLKPSNVLVQADGRVVVLDFGLVTVATARVLDRRIVGTARYMSPEQAAGAPADSPADVYSAGVLLGESLGPEPSPLADLVARMTAPDPNARPSAAELAASLEPRRPAQAWGGGLTDTFVGRKAELAVLAAALRRSVGERRATVVHLRGASGVGKSALLRAFCDQARAAALFLSGRCRPDEDIPFRAIDGVVDELAWHLGRTCGLAIGSLAPADTGPLAQMFPVLARHVPGSALATADETSRARAFRALGQVLGHLAEQRPVALVIDDVQWADDDSIELLSRVVRANAAAPVLVVLAGRGAAPPRRLPVDTCLDVGALDDTDARELVRLLSLSARTRVDAAQVALETAGHPLHIAELVRFLARQGSHVPRPRLDDAIAGRICELATAERELLELVCVAGALGRPELVSARPHRPRADAVRLLKRHLLREQPGSGQLEPYHDRVRDAVRARLSDARRRELHAIAYRCGHSRDGSEALPSPASQTAPAVSLEQPRIPRG